MNSIVAAIIAVSLLIPIKGLPAKESATTIPELVIEESLETPSDMEQTPEQIENNQSDNSVPPETQSVQQSAEQTRVIKNSNKKSDAAESSNLHLAAEIMINKSIEIQEQARLEQERLEQERIEAERLEQERLEQERIEEEKKNPINQYSQNEIDLICKIVYAESRGESDLGQKAVANVVINRVKSGKFAKSVEGVIFQKGQFSPAGRGGFRNIRYDAKTKANVTAVLSGERVIPDSVMYFNGAAGLPRKLYTKIGNHNFYY